ncbi:MAG: 30S ribosomal protein S2 [Candidatus Palauibacterales bacterium]|nr:30S ribosomal protein S2 [Candidatus Palauibacterales bacterium]MDP2530761.1 30S ribosomal protein S2 [Candidatus Palauibacterales bacterium]MDP2582719.1 30S ribosomal protein S2 [Candidatus Palauibacterales bacterium]
MADVALTDLLQAGVHFGHQTSRWNPKMRKYIFAERGGIYLLDLKKTQNKLSEARELVRGVVTDGGSVLFVCTKPQLAPLVREEAERCGAFYVTERWLGGMLTNFQTIKKNIRRLKELERGAEEGSFEFYTKKEQLLLDRERQKLDRYLSGIKDMSRLPGVIFVVDAKKEEIAVKEAHRLEIPVVAIADTNADPDMLTVPIPGNDDAIRSVALITRAIADSVDAARREAPEAAGEQAEDVFTYSSDVGETSETESSRRRKRPRRRKPRPEVIAQRRQTKGGATDEDAAGEDEAPEAGGAEAAAEPSAEADRPKGAGAEEPEDEVPVSAGAGGGEEEDEEGESS